MPRTVQTDPQLLEGLTQAAKHQFSRQELHQQRVSFIIGNLPKNSTITREQVEAALARADGETIAA